tara:strand:- start:28 stop:456 length:429 start_codon:yes stop_codon:yes gene_type:complete
MKKLFFVFMLLFFCGNVFSQESSIISIASNDNQISTEKTFYENDQLKYYKEYNFSTKSGKVMWYYQDGQLETEGFIRKNNKKDGIWKWYYKNGILSIEGVYKNDRRDGLWKFYNEDGTLKEEVNFKRGKKILTSSYEFIDSK